ncbi:MAG: amidohydrolase family protein [Acidobacteriota bacterium]|nr:amidohydrolase family protein [Acidobacteriota bacterium]
MNLVLLGFTWGISHAQDLAPEVLDYADIVLYNGQVLTMDGDQPPINVDESLAIRDDRILAVGKTDRILRMAGPDTVRVDLDGKAVIPGIVDTHSHPNDYAKRHPEFAREMDRSYIQTLRENNVLFTTVRWDSKETVLADLKTFAENAPPEKWIYTTFGIRPSTNKILKELTRHDLDRVVPENPLAITGFFAWGVVNTKMLAILQDNYGEKPLSGLVKDEQGIPNGQLLGAVSEIIDAELMPQRKPEVLAQGLKRELEEWVAIGVTTISTRLAGYEITSYGLLDRNGELPLRLAYAHEVGRANPFLERHLKRFGNLEGHGTDRMWIVGITIDNPDGYGPRIPTPDDGGRVGEISCGTLPKREILPNDLYPDEEFCVWDLPDHPGPNAALIANRYGYRITGLHTFGDKGIDLVLESYERASQESSIRDKRFALDHGMMIRPDLRQRSSDLGVMWSVQPIQFWGRYAASVSLVYGEEYAHQWLFPVKTLIDQGIKVVYGADTHDDPERHPMFSLEVLVTRKTKDGRIFGPRERIDRETALLMMTRWGSEYVLAEDKLGSIEPGKLADLVLLDKNPLDPNIPDDDLSEIKVLATIIGGEIAYGSLNP